MSLIKSAASGVKWSTTGMIFTTGLSLLQLPILARLLSPNDFGLMAMIMVIIGFANAYMDMGISAAIIHRQDVTRDHLSTLYWLNIFSGAVIFAVLVLITPLVILLYNEPHLKNLMYLGALTFLITPPGQQYQILLQKELHFRALAWIDIISSTVGTGTCITMAWMGYGVISLIWGLLVNALSRTFILMGIGWRQWQPALHFARADLKGYLSFGLYQMGERSINYFNSRLDHLLIGSLLGAQSLGYYSFAFNLAIQPISRINPVLTKVAFPVFAKMQSDNESLKKGYCTVLRMLSFVNFPLLVGLAAVAPIFVPLVFGNQWLPAVSLLQILSFVALLRSTGNPVGALQLAKGRADLGFKWNAMLMLTQIPCVIAGVHFGGIVGVALALLILQIIYFGLNYIILIRSLIGPCFKEYSTSMTLALVLSGIMVVPVLLIPLFAGAHPTVLVLTMQIASGGLLYFALNWFYRREELIALKEILVR
jgi:O-antigen/teichoic acid export membrane protein